MSPVICSCHRFCNISQSGCNSKLFLSLFHKQKFCKSFWFTDAFWSQRMRCNDPNITFSQIAVRQLWLFILQIIITQLLPLPYPTVPTSVGKRQFKYLTECKMPSHIFLKDMVQIISRAQAGQDWLHECQQWEMIKWLNVKILPDLQWSLSS